MISRSLFVESKKLRVFDFDDTLVKTKSFVYVKNKKTGREFRLTPGEYAVYTPKSDDEFDYKDFTEIKDPIEIKKVTNVLRRIVKASGGKGVYILTARGSYKPIKQYLKDIGIDKYIHIIALGSSDPKHKAEWIEYMIDAENYDDIYFADDSPKNVRAVKQMLRTKPIKWRVQQIKENKYYKE